MINVNVHSRLKTKNLQVSGNGAAVTGSPIQPFNSGHLTLSELQGNSEGVEIAVLEPEMEYPFMIEVPPGIQVSITSRAQGKDWKLMLTMITGGNQGSNAQTAANKKTAGTDHMVIGTTEDPKVNVTVGQDIPPVNIMSNKAIAALLFGVGVGLAAGHYAYKLSPLLWGGLSAMAIIAGIITGILACKKETPQADKTEPKQVS